MRLFITLCFLFSILYLDANDSTRVRINSRDSIIIHFEQLEKILQVKQNNKLDFLEIVKLFAPAIAGGITALFALLGISKQIRNAQNLQRLDLLAKKKDSLISTYSDLIFEIEKEGDNGLINLMKKTPPSYYFAKKEVELKLQISSYFTNVNDYSTFFKKLNFFRENKINNKAEVHDWLDSLESEFKKIITKI